MPGFGLTGSDIKVLPDKLQYAYAVMLPEQECISRFSSVRLYSLRNQFCVEFVQPADAHPVSFHRNL